MKFRLLVLLAGVLGLIGCFGGGGNGKKPGVVRLGVTAGPHMEILEDVKVRAAAEGLELRLVEFNDYILPNAALVEGALDANSYQHVPFLEDQVASRGYPLKAVAKTILLPIGVYTVKGYGGVQELKKGAKVAVPNDPTNGGRALLLLEDLGLIGLKEGVGVKATVLDIVRNDLGLKIIELEAPQIPRAIRDVDVAVINTDWALIAGLGAPIERESSDSPYANIIVVREGDEGDEDIMKLIEIYQSEATRAFIKRKFGRSVMAAW